jgi:hypothetical protein
MRDWNNLNMNFDKWPRYRTHGQDRWIVKKLPKFVVFIAIIVLMIIVCNGIDIP